MADVGRRRPSGVGVLEALTAGLLALYVGSTVFRRSGSSLPLFDTWIGNLSYGGSTLLCGWRAVHVRRHRAAWGALALAFALFTTGSVLWTSVIQYLDPVPYPSLADLFFLLFYPLAYLGIGLMIRRSLADRSAMVWLDGLIAGLGIAALTTALVIGPISHGARGELGTVLTNLAYPVGDLLLVAMLVGFFALRGWRPPSMWWALGIGLVVFAVADSVYVWRVTAGVYVTGTPLDAQWAVAAFIVALAAWHGRDAEAESSAPRQPILMPAAFLLSSLGIIVFATFQRVVTVAVMLASADLLIAIARMGMSYRQLRALAESRREARTDELTGLGNRRMFYQALQSLLDDGGEQPSLLMIDLDRFKEINDSLGHRVGDVILRDLGPRLASALPEGDVLARLGGDEFGVLVLSGRGERSATFVAERLQHALEQPFAVEGITLRVDASIGIVLGGEHGEDADSLLQRADVAMYEAKRQHLPWVVYAPERDEHTRERLQLVEELRDAIPRGDLLLHYQPKLDLASNRITGVEALVRWNHPSRGLLAPGEFLELAEQTGLIRPIGVVVLHQAIAQLAAWQRDGLDVTVAVNLSASDLLDEKLPSFVAGLLHQYRARPWDLVVEVTEGALMLEPARRVLHELRSLGCEIAVDDYGTGFASLGYLRDLPVTELKLDRSFLADIDDDERALAIVRSTIDLAHSLGLRMVAEGVEDEGTLELLRRLGCDHAQGFFIGRPKAEPEVSDFLRSALAGIPAAR